MKKGWDGLRSKARATVGFLCRAAGCRDPCDAPSHREGRPRRKLRGKEPRACVGSRAARLKKAPAGESLGSPPQNRASHPRCTPGGPRSAERAAGRSDVDPCNPPSSPTTEGPRGKDSRAQTLSNPTQHERGSSHTGWAMGWEERRAGEGEQPRYEREARGVDHMTCPRAPPKRGPL